MMEQMTSKSGSNWIMTWGKESMVVILVHHDGSPLRSAIASATPQRLSTAPVASATTAPLPALPPRRHTDPTPHRCRPCQSPSISIWKKIVRDAADPIDLVCIRGPGSEDGHRGARDGGAAAEGPSFSQSRGWGAAAEEPSFSCGQQF